MAVMGKCALCRKEAELRQSHIVPSFFGAYLKETSATGYLRGAVTPNLRIQDLSKETLLCDSCERRFSIWEKKYKEEAFEQVQSDSFRDLEYGPWLQQFIVSLNWRVLVTQGADFGATHPRFACAVNRTLESWRLFLLGERSQPTSEHHLFVFAGIPESMPDGLHEKILYYMLRSVDATVASSTSRFFVYTKALRALMFSPIIPTSPKGLVNTRIHAGGGRLVSPQKVAMRGFGDFLDSRAKEYFAQKLSESQKARINETILRQPDRALSSESYKVHEATMRLVSKPGEKGAW